jgi:hypothetical protein
VEVKIDQSYALTYIPKGLMTIIPVFPSRVREPTAAMGIADRLGTNTNLSAHGLRLSASGKFTVRDCFRSGQMDHRSSSL